MTIDEFFALLNQRLDDGARQYGDRSFLRSIRETESQILEEQVDEVGWCYVLWCQAARKTGMAKDQTTLRIEWERRLRHRILRNDRRRAEDYAVGIDGAMADLEVLAVDLFHQAEQTRQRLHQIARAIEVAVISQPHTYRGRRGGRGADRSDD